MINASIYFFLTCIFLFLRFLPTHEFRSLTMSSGNSFGKLFKITTFGESHGPAVGVIIDGCPPKVLISSADIQDELDRRKPGQSRLTTPRNEEDKVEILSGISDNITTGTPISLLIRNKNQRSGDYDELSFKYRPSHADATYDAKYGVRAVAGGGRSSARETIGRVAAGALAKKVLFLYSGVEIIAYVKSVQDIVLNYDDCDHDNVTREMVEANIIRCPDPLIAESMIKRIDAIRRTGDSVGGIVEFVVRNLPSGLGGPVFEKLEAELAKACLSIPATKGFEIGSGFGGTILTGYEHNDEFYIDKDGRTRTRSNRSGGVQGGISNGENIVGRVCFKPTSTIGREQNTVSREGEEITLRGKGRHDPCVLPRAVPVVEAMVALVLVDALMQHNAQCALFTEFDSPPENVKYIRNSLGKKINGYGIST